MFKNKKESKILLEKNLTKFKITGITKAVVTITSGYYY